MKTENLVITIVVAFFAVMMLGWLFSYSLGFNNYGYGMMSMMGNFFGGFGAMRLFGWLFMLLILIALILFIAWLSDNYRFRIKLQGKDNGKGKE